MIYRFVCHCFLFISIFAVSFEAYGQACRVDYELIFKMNDPVIGSYNVWDTVYGEKDKEEHLVSGVFDHKELLIVVGKQFAKDKRYEDKPDEVDLLVVGFGRRGRMEWEHVYDIKGLTDVLKILPIGKEYLVR